MDTFWMVTLFLAAGLYRVEGCGSKSIECITSTTYRYCFVSGSQIIYVDQVVTCSDGTVCDENVGSYACITDNSATTTTSTSTTPSTATTTTSTSTSTTTSPTTTSTTPTTATTTTSTSTSTTTSPTTTSTTTASTTSSTTTQTTTTTVASVTAPSSCDSSGVYQAENCNQYYECVFVMWWYELVLQTCSSGQAFNSTTGQCQDDSSCTA